MKLGHTFYRLPIRFDVERLRAEVRAMPTEAWSRHPNEFAGNTAARLITVGGGQNDDVGGAMVPTAALRTSPYLQQVLASFHTVLSRCRLMRIAPGEQVPQHSDVNYHWFYRVRIHVPIQTRPEVRFYCEDESVHMGAGEAWIFDNWRQHRVENPTAEERIHLVADTTGTSAFWRMVAQAQTADFAQPAAHCPLIAFDPAARVRLLTERFNVAPVMPPAEVEQLAFDLLAELAPVDATQPAADAVHRFVGTVVDFCRDWRSIWSLYGDTPDGRLHYEQLLNHVREQCARTGPVAVAAAGVLADHVLNARVLGYALGPSGGRSREAAEFGGPAVEPGPPRGPAVDLPRIERPLIILSAPRAGSTLLFETLARAEGLHTIGGESHLLIEGLDALRPGGGCVNSNRLTAADASPEVVAELRERFARALRDREGRHPAPGAPVRLLEKTPKNALRVPFLLEVFPDALFVFLHREPRANLSSIMEAWRSGGWVTYRELPDWNGDWSLLLPPGYAALTGRPLEEIAAFQWNSANRVILDDLATLPADRWTEVRYEDLVTSPATEIPRLLEFAGITADQGLLDHLSHPLPLSQYTQSEPAADKWRRNENEINRVIGSVREVAARLGR